MALRGINRIPAANVYLQNEFIADFNARFAVQARERETAYKPLPQGLNLDLAFCYKSRRKIAPNQTFSFEATLYVLQTKRDLRFRTVEICAAETGKLRFVVGGEEFNATRAQDMPLKIFKPAA